MGQAVSSGRSRIRTVTGRIEVILLWVFTVLLVIDVLLGILARYVHFEVVFADELGKYLFIWLCTIGISAAAKDNQHVRLSFIASKLPVPRKLIRVISQLLFLAFTAFYFFWSVQLTWMHFQMDKSVMGFEFPMYLFTAALPFGFGLTSIRLIQDIVDILSSNANEGPVLNEFAIREKEGEL
jgi:TRAP-type C4-dicarboxylate transport system permease small subunit